MSSLATWSYTLNVNIQAVADCFNSFTYWRPLLFQEPILPALNGFEYLFVKRLNILHITEGKACKKLNLHSHIAQHENLNSYLFTVKQEADEACRFKKKKEVGSALKRPWQVIQYQSNASNFSYWWVSAKWWKPCRSHLVIPLQNKGTF